MAKARKGAGKSRARKPAAAKAADPKKIVRQLTPEKDLNSLLRVCKNHEKNIGELVGSLREKIGYAVEKHHLHKRAFGMIRSLNRLEAPQLAAFFDHFDHYCDVSGLRERAESAPSLDLGDKPGEGDKTEEEDYFTEIMPERPAKDAGDGKVTTLKGRRKTMGEMMHEPGGALAPEHEPPAAEQAAVG